MTSQWDLKPGAVIRRRDLHQRFGGRSQGGIGPSRQSPNVFVFSDSKSGEQHGYYDGWQEDGCFHYTGEGQRGDQRLKSGNTAVLKHKKDGRALRVFAGAGGPVEYIDEFEIDDFEPYYRTDAPETGGGPRREVIVFRLRPKTIEPEPSNSRLAPVLSGPKVVSVPIEKQQTEKAYVEPSRVPYEAERREQALVIELSDLLASRGHEVERQRILPTGEGRPLLTDLYDATTETLVEAKGTVERGAIRMAIGQLADYKRFVNGGHPKHLAVLLPNVPRKDLEELLLGEGIAVIYPTGGSFEDSTGGALLEAQ